MDCWGARSATVRTHGPAIDSETDANVDLLALEREHDDDGCGIKEVEYKESEDYY